MFFKTKLGKYIKIIIVFVLLSTLYCILTTKMAGYNYLLFTSTQMEIIPKDTDWDIRKVIHDKKQINDILSIISDAKLSDGNSMECNLQNNDLSLIIRRNFAKNDLSW